MSIVAETATLAHGLTMDVVQRLAGSAVRSARRYVSSMDSRDQYELAWMAIVELIYTRGDKPTTLDMIDAGQKAIKNEYKRQLADHGVDKDTLGAKVNHGKYWASVAGPTPDFTEAIAERIALPQVLGALTADQYEALAAVAVYGNQRVAADALGISDALLKNRLNKARDRIIRLWMEGESPWVLRKVDFDKECKAGHQREGNTYINKKTGHRMCRRCLTLNARRQVAAGRKG